MGLKSKLEIHVYFVYIALRQFRMMYDIFNRLVHKSSLELLSC